MNHPILKNKFFLDFEFNRTTNKYVNLVSCSATDLVKQETKWLFKSPETQDRFADYLFSHRKKTFVSFSVEAEARSMLALGLDLKDFKFIDLWLEYKCLTNHSKLAYGKHLVDGKVIVIPPPKPKYLRDDDEKSGKVEHSLASMTYKFLGKLIDTEEKERIRNLIISNPKIFTPEQQKRILKYNASDIEYLPQLLVKSWEHYHKFLKGNSKLMGMLEEEMLYRGKYAVANTHMVTQGYPIDLKATMNFSKNVPHIMMTLQRDINSQFEIKPFKFSPRTGKYTWNYERTIANMFKYYPDLMKRWPKSKKTGKYSLKSDLFERAFAFQHSYPRNVFGAQIVRFTKTKKSLNGFRVSKSKNKTFWDYVGKDGWVRPYFNIYGSQSARSQPSATGFLFLKAAWMRVLETPPKGWAITGIDWSSQEFLVGGLNSKDKAMISDYETGDVYLAFGKRANRIPKDATKKTHGPVRDRFKSTVLGIMYWMMEESLARKITNDTGVKCSVDDALDLITDFEESYPDFNEARKDWVEDYRSRGYIKLPDGWYMWGENINERSIANCPIQGTASCAMRRSVLNAQDKSLIVIKTLHDCIYILHRSNDLESIDILDAAMDEGFRSVFPENIRHLATCRRDITSWSLDYAEGAMPTRTPKGRPIKAMAKYVDQRSLDDYEKFKQYFADSDTDYI